MPNTKINPNELFSLLVNQLSAGAWSQLGKTPNPITGKPEKNLEAAAVSIGILESLLFKTAGNLNRQEDVLLSDKVRELKLSLVEESNKRSL
ncbi:MAG: DUF1844 domain-containing protein [Candidatus Marinimicrobia bacterium]|jgi:hypothetical protein|nr:DUF1844 domain-containing protein [Candidatus Neomarinimicrobiota bacterium]MBT3680974.1 DUF1844 domain-containing protein [Candidatus Neomarinimicrobiota bacterium]MBT3952107.1 DUF1844 domain-containing protein [Candidatus Neomarinimicrobiota bacterium]MBT4254305.1 DUF1844 domain-containing protein [Candidatus Neomarinimicrobiota bacterium]MBT4479486.1 DUF1844 domain-containing protein [Candidatus Neomarinimicrobiota bacterium]